MAQKNSNSLLINQYSLIVWIILFSIGIWLSIHKPLWCDELFGQKLTVENSSWKKIITGHCNNEGNNFPLYYSLQKVITHFCPIDLPKDLESDFQLPDLDRKYFIFAYPKGQILLRLLPNALMTTAIVLLMRFFWIKNGLAVALMALFSALTSGMVWQYWVEARPYPLWFLLTIINALLIIDATRHATLSKKFIIIFNWLLCLSAPLGFIQVLMAQLILYIYDKRQIMFHLFAGLLPSLIAILLINSRPGIDLYLILPPKQLLLDNFSLEQGTLLIFYFLAFLCRNAWVKININDTKSNSFTSMPFILFFILGLSFSISLVLYISWRWPHGNSGFPVYSRHFLYLAALSVVLIPVLFNDLWQKSQKNFFWRFIFLFLFIIVLLSQFIQGFTQAWIGGFYS